MEEQKKIIPFRNPRRERWRLGLFFGILGVLILVLIFFAVDEGRNRDAVSRFFSYGNEDLTLELSGPVDTAAVLDGNLATVGKDGVTLYDRDGKIQFLAAAGFSAPVVFTDNGMLLAYDAGGTELVLLNDSGKLLLEDSGAGPIFDADMASDGSVACTTGGDRDKSRLQVYDREQLPCYTVYSATRFLTTCAVSPGAGYVCAVALGETDGGFQSFAVIYRTDREEPVAEVPLGSQLIYDMRFWGKDRICALGENGMVVFDTAGKLLGTYAYTGLEAYCLEGDDFAALTLRSGSDYRLVTVDYKGRELGSRELGQSPGAVDVNGKYVAVLQNGTLTIGGRKLDTWYEARELFGDLVRITGNGAAYIIESQTARRFLP